MDNEEGRIITLADIIRLPNPNRIIPKKKKSNNGIYDWINVILKNGGFIFPARDDKIAQSIIAAYNLDNNENPAYNKASIQDIGAEGIYEAVPGAKGLLKAEPEEKLTALLIYSYMAKPADVASLSSDKYACPIGLLGLVVSKEQGSGDETSSLIILGKDRDKILYGDLGPRKIGLEDKLNYSNQLPFWKVMRHGQA
ncbi:hypothetical protein KY358_04175 [Candidatus Woesearchaeota archaeon]|nr:hypothetical protein [Candidatus Woesearchaeota archaeon]